MVLSVHSVITSSRTPSVSVPLEAVSAMEAERQRAEGAERQRPSSVPSAVTASTAGTLELSPVSAFRPASNLFTH
jgi:hypothetical protein